jgi:N-hydroxyarylamine O-acetyltransferase
VTAIDTTTQDRLLHRIGLDAPPAADTAGLRALQRAFVSHVPFEDIAVQLGESAPLDPDALVQRMLTGGRGGYCFEVNTVFALLLESLGFAVERRQAIVGPRGAFAAGERTNHLALVVRTAADEAFIAEGGWGEGPLEPLPLAEGPVTVGAFTFVVDREGDGWWIAQHEHGASPGFRFADAPSTLADFEPFHRYQSTAPESGFVQTLLVQRPYQDRIVSLRARTFFVDGPGIRERRLLEDQDAFATTLSAAFGIDTDVLGAERLDRLWANAERQHEAHRHRTRGPADG